MSFIPVTDHPSSHKYNKYYEKYYQDNKNLDDKPAVGWHRLKVFQYLRMRSLYIQMWFFHVGINPKHTALPPAKQQTRTMDST